MGKMPSFESLGVHPTLVSALRRVAVQPTPFQARVLANTTTDFADIVVDGRAAGGGAGGDGSTSSRAVTAERHNLITIFTAHCLLAAKEPSRCTAVVIASSKDCAAQLQKSMKTFASYCNIDFYVLANEGQKPPLLGDDGGDSQASSSASKGGRIFITTLRVLRTWDKEFLKSITTLAVEDASRNNERHLEEVLRLLTPLSPQPPPAATATGAGATISSNVSAGNVNTSRPLVNIFLMYLVPLTKVSPGIRYCLSRRNRRYYHLQGTSPATWVPPQTPSGTAPPSSTQLVHLLYLDEKDREELLRRVLQVYHSRRILLLTHHKEIKHLYQTVCKWDLYNTSTNDPSNSSGRVSDFTCCMFRSDSAERQETSLTSFTRDQNTNNSNSNHSGSYNNSRRSSALLISWDAFTAVDLMDVDVFIQYYPPQKSLTERERAEYIQVLHTTADPDESHRGRRTVLITFLTVSDFTLASFFMRQYGQNGPILNIAPNHPEFERCLSDPKGLLKLKQRKEGDRRDRERDDAGHNATASSGCSGGPGAAPVPLPRSMRYTSPGMRKEKVHSSSDSSKGGRNNNNNNNNNAARGGGGGGGAVEKSHGGGKWGDGRPRRAGGEALSRANSTSPSPSLGADTWVARGGSNDNTAKAKPNAT
ncbi:hypothetical protein DQ04_03511000 [Trypanosoma grayi]|uniref:hypothetical protein n=1 Tax=Trypanosoma grayi TaxID=71804 RepID=UPI0004F3FA72|nr:hypothetical protein DQ04_03511000 [Trypanosoma grayi]KEG10608.1 hypothetical protein DQ04_03511000 [Trypanosoma grayi]